MAQKYWDHLKLKNGDSVKFIPPAPDGTRLGGITEIEKTKLSGIEEGATKTVVDDELSDSSTNPVQNKVINSKLTTVENDISELDKNVFHLTGDETANGIKTIPTIQTGTSDAAYFQSKKFRGEGDASTYYHAIDFGCSGTDEVNFYEYGGKFVFHKHTGKTKDDNDTVVGSIQSDGLYEGSTKLSDKYQAKLIAGSGITIGSDGKTISSTGGTTGTSENYDDLINDVAEIKSDVSSINNKITTTTKTGTSIEITDALACKPISCSCDSAITISGNNLINCGSIGFTWYKDFTLDTPIVAPSGGCAYKFSLEVSTNHPTDTTLLIIFYNEDEEVRYIDCPVKEGRQTFYTWVNEGETWTRYRLFAAASYVNAVGYTCSWKDVMLTRNWNWGGDDEPVEDYEPYIKSTTYTDLDEISLLSQPMILSSDSSISITYIVNTSYVQSLLSNTSSASSGSGGAAGGSSPEIYGASGNGSSDDTEAIQTAIDSENIVYLNGTYATSKPIVISGENKHIYINGNIVYTGSDSGAIEIYGLTNSDIYINNITANNADCIVFNFGKSSCYNNFHLNGELKANTTTGACIRAAAATSSDWEDNFVTEQHFYGGHFAEGKWGIYQDAYADGVDPAGNFAAGGYSFTFINTGFEIVDIGAELHNVYSILFIQCRMDEQGHNKTLLKTVGHCSRIGWIGEGSFNGRRNSLSDETYGFIMGSLCYGPNGDSINDDNPIMDYGTARIVCGKIIPENLHREAGFFVDGLNSSFISDGTLDLRNFTEADGLGLPSTITIYDTTVNNIILNNCYGRISGNYSSPNQSGIKEITIFFPNGKTDSTLTISKENSTDSSSVNAIFTITGTSQQYKNNGILVKWYGVYSGWGYQFINTKDATIGNV